MFRSSFLRVDHNPVWQVSLSKGESDHTYIQGGQEAQGEDSYVKANWGGPFSRRDQLCPCLDYGPLACRTVRYAILSSASHRPKCFVKELYQMNMPMLAAPGFLLVGQAWCAVPIILGNWEKGTASVRLSWATQWDRVSSSTCHYSCILFVFK